MNEVLFGNVVISLLDLRAQLGDLYGVIHHSRVSLGLLRLVRFGELDNFKGLLCCIDEGLIGPGQRRGDLVRRRGITKRSKKRG